MLSYVNPIMRYLGVDFAIGEYKEKNIESTEPNNILTGFCKIHF